MKEFEIYIQAIKAYSGILKYRYKKTIFNIRNS